MNPIQPKGLDHVVLRVTQMESAITFYEEILGCTVERRIDEVGLVQLRAGNSLIDLVDVSLPIGRAGGGMPDADARNMDHFALTLSSFDETLIRERLAHFGIEAGDTLRLYGAEGYGPSIYIRDPDGNTVELKGPSEPDSRSTDGRK